MMPLDSNDLLKARDLLQQGDVVAIPTETVYGLAASIESEKGLRKIFAVKERPFFDPLIVHVASIKEAQSLAAEWPPLADYLARSFWPGPLTVVVPKASHVNSLITSGLDTVAIRFPSHPIAQDLIRMTGTPLAAPSANKFGRTSPSRAEHVRSEFPDPNLMIIDGGDCEVGLESTVIALGKNAEGKDEVSILRPGAVTREMLEETLERWWPQATVSRTESQASPGHLEHHYMPKIPLAIVPESTSHPLGRTMLDSIAAQLKRDAATEARELVLSDDAAQAAQELYGEMRRLAESGADLLWIRSRPDRKGGLWMAIWDRIKRAATVDLTR